jgi:DNA helicase IV
LSAGAWALDCLTLATPTGTHSFIGADASRLSVSRWWFSHSLVVQGLEPGRFRGVRWQDVPAIRSAAEIVVARAELAPMLSRLTDCRVRLTEQVGRQLVQGRWIPYAGVWHLMPTWEDLQRLEQASAAGFLTVDEHEALATLGTYPWRSVREANETITRDELARNRAFFDQVEKTPLTVEQARAVVTYDNRVRVIAVAGSGKTSVMVARAAYAIARGFAAPERILMLAFNADAAAELQTRVTARLAALGLPSEGLQATTFHSFGRSLIGRATGRKPSIAAWVENGAETEKVSAIIDDLRTTSDDFRFKWDIFRLLHGRVSGTPDGGEPDGYDRASRRAGFKTFHGETVRSEGERLIADWLYLNGVEYRYEQPYPHDVADSSHAQYRPDFYYPQLDVWHEHWALRADGTPPDSFAGYADDMAWKRNTHRQYGTTLLETTWHEIIDLRGFGALAAQLRAHGQQLDWNPDRATPGADSKRSRGL